MSNVIRDDIGKVVALMRARDFSGDFSEDFDKGKAPHYMDGRVLEIVNTMKVKDRMSVQKNQKYPAVFLITPIDEQEVNGLYNYNLRVMFVAKTASKYTRDQRYSKVLKPILYPMYESFIRNLRKSGLFTWPGYQKRPPHVKTDFPLHGTATEYQVVKQLFGDYIDAIEIRDLKINAHKRNECLTEVITK
jgi:hypothetical protein